MLLIYIYRARFLIFTIPPKFKILIMIVDENLQEYLSKEELDFTRENNSTVQNCKKLV